MKNLLSIFCGCVLIFIISCGEDNITPEIDTSVQRATDIALIEDFFSSKGYTEIDTTESGVRYVIVEEGAGESIDESDVVTFDYTGHLVSDTIFDTSIKTVLDSIRTAVIADSVGLDDRTQHALILSVFSETRNTDPLVVTYSASGWPFSGRFIQGFTDGLVASFNSKNSENGKKNVKIGGKVLIGIPSDLAYGTSGSGIFIDPNTPILFELYPTKVEKQ